eukprot:gene9341-11457_t
MVEIGSITTNRVYTNLKKPNFDNPPPISIPPVKIEKVSSASLSPISPVVQLPTTPTLSLPPQQQIINPIPPPQQIINQIPTNEQQQTKQSFYERHDMQLLGAFVVGVCGAVLYFKGIPFFKSLFSNSSDTIASSTEVLSSTIGNVTIQPSNNTKFLNHIEWGNVDLCAGKKCKSTSVNAITLTLLNHFIKNKLNPLIQSIPHDKLSIIIEQQKQSKLKLLAHTFFVLYPQSVVYVHAKNVKKFFGLEYGISHQDNKKKMVQYIGSRYVDNTTLTKESTRSIIHNPIDALAISVYFILKLWDTNRPTQIPHIDLPIQRVFNSIKKKVSSVFTGIGNAGKTVYQDIVKPVLTLPVKIFDKGSAMVGQIVDRGTQTIQNLGGGITKGIENTTQGIGSMFSSMGMLLPLGIGVVAFLYLSKSPLKEIKIEKTPNESSVKKKLQSKTTTTTLTKPEKIKPIVEKKKYSCFHLTINTQYQPKTDGEASEVGEKLASAMDLLFNNESYSKNLFKIIQPREDGLDRINDVKIEYSIEIGKNPKGGRVHSHSIIDTEHNTKINLDVDYIRSTLPSLMNDSRVSSNFYVNVKAVLSKKNLEEYIRKDQQPQPQNNKSDPIVINDEL